jgi:RNA polymerase primary sigma factor
VAAAVGLPLHHVQEVREAARAVTSLDKTIGEEDQTTLAELFPSEAAEPDEQIGTSQRDGLLRRAVAELPERERKIVCLRYGLEGGRRPQSVEQVVRALGVSRAEVRDLERDALERLSQRGEMESLRDVA